MRGRGARDIQKQENDNGSEPTPAEIEAWKRNEIGLWACTYTFTGERVERETVMLSDKVAADSGFCKWDE